MSDRQQQALQLMRDDPEISIHEPVPGSFELTHATMHLTRRDVEEMERAGLIVKEYGYNGVAYWALTPKGKQCDETFSLPLYTQAAIKAARTQALREGFEAGWRVAANWIEEGSTITLESFGSPAYNTDRDAAIRRLVDHPARESAP